MTEYDYESNSIHTEEFKSRLGESINNVYKTVHTLITSRELKAKLHLLYNECEIFLLIWSFVS